MSVLSILSAALRGGRRPSEGSKEVSLAAALTSGLYEVSQAMSSPAGDVQHSLDLITSAAASILRVERCVLLLPEPGVDHLVVRSMAGIPRGRQFEKYRQEIYKMVVHPVLSSGTGMIVSEGRPATDRALLRLMRRLEVKGFLAAPVKSPTTAIGIMAAATPLDGRDLQDGDLKLLSVLANFAAIALENAALIGHLDKKARKLTAIFEISKALNEQSDPAVLFQLIVDRATELMGASSGSIIRMDPDTGRGHRVGGAGRGAAARSRCADGLPLRAGESRGDVRDGGTREMGIRGDGSHQPGPPPGGRIHPGGPRTAHGVRQRGGGGPAQRHLPRRVVPEDGIGSVGASPGVSGIPGGFHPVPR
jgi:GAF domain-containing protein